MVLLVSQIIVARGLAFTVQVNIALLPAVTAMLDGDATALGETMKLITKIITVISHDEQ